VDLAVGTAAAVVRILRRRGWAATWWHAVFWSGSVLARRLAQSVSYRVASTNMRPGGEAGRRPAMVGVVALVSAVARSFLLVKLDRRPGSGGRS
jgi:hypothetical protein